MGSHEQRRGTFYWGCNRTPLRGKSREACQNLAAAVVQARDDGVALVISWPWDQRRDQAQHPLSPALERGLQSYFECDNRAFASPRSSAG